MNFQENFHKKLYTLQMEKISHFFLKVLLITYSNYICLLFFKLVQHDPGGDTKYHINKYSHSIK